MKLEQSFEVDAPLDQVWAALIDVERVAPNLPGAAVTGRNDDGTYNGTFTIKIGPTTASYTGKLEMQNVDEGSHSATMYAQGSDRRGQGGATATISSTLTPLNGSRTRVEVATDYHITGRLARFGRGGMIEDISERLLREFAGRLQSSLAGAPPTAEHRAAVADEAPPVGGEEESEQPTSETVMTPAVEAGAAAAAPPPTEAAGEAPEAPAPEAEAVPPPTDAEPPPPGAGPPPPPPPPPPADSAPPVQGLSLVGGVLLSRIKRNPAPLIGAIAALVLLRLLLRKR
jgi:carbon monoxide dehydrogenase subunit G